MIGASFTAQTALHTVLHLIHLLVKLVSEIHTIRGTAQEQIHAVAAFYLNTHSARLAIATAATEIA